MPPLKAIRLPAFLALAFMALIGLAALALASGVALAGCANSASGAAGPHVEPEWRLVPEGTALGQRRQFFLYGRHLDSVQVSAPPSVVVEKSQVSAGGRALSLYMTVNALLKDSLAKGETQGWRVIGVKTLDTSLTFKLKVTEELLNGR
jgi:hypothetical protein